MGNQNQIGGRYGYYARGIKEGGGTLNRNLEQVRQQDKIVVTQDVIGIPLPIND